MQKRLSSTPDYKYDHQFLLNMALEQFAGGNSLSAAAYLYDAFSKGSQRAYDFLFEEGMYQALEVTQDDDVEERRSRQLDLPEDSSAIHFQKGLCYLAGIPPFERSKEKALTHLKKAADQKHLDAKHVLGLSLLLTPQSKTDKSQKEKRQPQVGYTHIIESAKLSHPGALSTLPSSALPNLQNWKVFTTFTTFETEPSAAKRRFLSALEKQDHPALLHFLGAFAEHEGKLQDALAYYKKAANAGFTSSQVHLLIQHIKNTRQPTANDCFSDHDWDIRALAEEAAAEGVPLAQWQLGELYHEAYEKNPGEKDDDLKKAYDWHLQAAEQNYSPSLYALGALLLEHSHLGNAEGAQNENNTKACEYFARAISTAKNQSTPRAIHLDEWVSFYERENQNAAKLSKEKLLEMHKNERTLAFIQAECDQIENIKKETLLEALDNDDLPFDDIRLFTAKKMLKQVLSNKDESTTSFKNLLSQFEKQKNLRSTLIETAKNSINWMNKPPSFKYPYESQSAEINQVKEESDKRIALEPFDIDLAEHNHQFLLNNALDFFEQGDSLAAADYLHQSLLAGSHFAEDFFFDEYLKLPEFTLTEKALTHQKKQKNSENTPETLFRKGLCYLKGIPPFEQSYQNAFSHLEEAANKGSVRAQTFLGSIYYRLQQFRPEMTRQEQLNEAFQHLKASAEKEDPSAYHELGCLYEKSLITVDEKDPLINEALATYYFEKAAEKGLSSSLFKLGRLKERKKDYKTAKEHYEKAAKKGHFDAQLKLAYLYLKGKIDDSMMGPDSQAVDKKTNKNRLAQEYAEKAAQQNNTYAQYFLASMFIKGLAGDKTATEIERIKSAYPLYFKAASKGDPKPQRKIAQYHIQYHKANRTKKGATTLREERNSWYKKAADQDDFKATYELALIYKKGDTFFPKEIADIEACSLLLKAACLMDKNEKNNPDPMSQLREMHQESRTVKFIEAFPYELKTLTKKSLAIYFNAEDLPIEIKLCVAAELLRREIQTKEVSDLLWDALLEAPVLSNDTLFELVEKHCSLQENKKPAQESLIVNESLETLREEDRKVLEKKNRKAEQADLLETLHNDDFPLNDRKVFAAKRILKERLAIESKNVIPFKKLLARFGKQPDIKSALLETAKNPTMLSHKNFLLETAADIRKSEAPRETNKKNRNNHLFAITMEGAEYVHETLLRTAIDLLDEGNSLVAADCLYQAALAGSIRATEFFHDEHYTLLNSALSPSNKNKENRQATQLKAENTPKTLFRKGLCYFKGIPPFEQSYENAFSSLKDAADQGYADAASFLGSTFLLEQCHPEMNRLDRLANAFAHFKAAAEKEDPRAYGELGSLYIDNQISTPEGNPSTNKALAAYYFQKGEAKGSPFSSFHLGLLERENENYEKAKTHFANAASKGLSLAQFELGRLYLENLISTSSPEADQSEAQRRKANDKEARQWLEKAREQRHCGAEYLLAEMIMANLANDPAMSEKDKSKMARFYYLRAARQGLPQAQKRLIQHAPKFDRTGTQLHETKITWYTRLSEKNDFEATYELGLIYKEKGRASSVAGEDFYAFSLLLKATYLAHFASEEEKNQRDPVSQLQEMHREDRITDLIKEKEFGIELRHEKKEFLVILFNEKGLPEAIRISVAAELLRREIKSREFNDHLWNKLLEEPTLSNNLLLELAEKYCALEELPQPIQSIQPALIVNESLEILKEEDREATEKKNIKDEVNAIIDKLIQPFEEKERTTREVQAAIDYLITAVEKAEETALKNPAYLETTSKRPTRLNRVEPEKASLLSWLSQKENPEDRKIFNLFLEPEENSKKDTDTMHTSHNRL